MSLVKVNDRTGRGPIKCDAYFFGQNKSNVFRVHLLLTEKFHFNIIKNKKHIIV